MTEEPLKGLENVLSNLNKEIVKIKGHTLQGLIRAQIVIWRDMDRNAPRIPVDLGNLRASYFVVTSEGKTERGSTPTFRGDAKNDLASDHPVVTEKWKLAIYKSKDPKLTLGFTAFYAGYVHEMVGADFTSPRPKKKGKYWTEKRRQRRPGAGAKFMESAVNNNRKTILDEVRKSVRYL